MNNDNSGRPRPPKLPRQTSNPVNPQPTAPEPLSPAPRKSGNAGVIIAIGIGAMLLGGLIVYLVMKGNNNRDDNGEFYDSESVVIPTEEEMPIEIEIAPEETTMAESVVVEEYYDETPAVDEYYCPPADSVK